MYKMKISSRIESTMSAFAVMAAKRNQRYARIAVDNNITANILFGGESLSIYMVRGNKIINGQLASGEPKTIKMLAVEFIRGLGKKQKEAQDIKELNEWIKTLNKVG